MKEYNKNNTKKAQYLRKNATPWERKLWYEFLKDYPIRFQRQKPIDNFVADFYCAKAGIVLELDGGEHFSSQTLQYDQMRTEILQKKGVKVVRLIETCHDIKEADLKNADTVAITAGASTPTYLTNQVIDVLKKYSETKTLNLPPIEIDKIL